MNKEKILKLLLKIKPGTLLKYAIKPYVLFSDRFMKTSLATCTRCRARERTMNMVWENFINKKIVFSNRHRKLLD
jgi:hypothetical protein